LGYDVTSVVRVGPKSSHYPQVTPLGGAECTDVAGWEPLANQGGPSEGEEWCSRALARAEHRRTELIMNTSAVLDVPELLTTAEVAALLKVNRSTLSRWRSAGAGPRVTWLTANIPRYQRADVVEWLRQAAV
jgi:predicted DNA-binding transcriptional regulator AlpA